VFGNNLGSDTNDVGDTEALYPTSSDNEHKEPNTTE